MNKFLQHTVVQITLGLVTMVVLFYGIWAYINSFQTVSFEFDDKLGYIELVDNSEQALYPKSQQPVRLKKGEYVVRNIGDRITKDEKKITIDHTTRDIKVSFSYAEKYLSELYVLEKATIHTVLFDTYPKITELYEIRDDRLYGKADIFGATLIAKNQAGDNTDTLHVLLQKKSGKWQVISKPPAPILSAQDYPDVPRDILVQINKS